jgi:coenzyme F420 hydrogenase subunit beta
MKRDEMFYALKEEVIDPGYCVLCGSCSAYCDRIDLDYDSMEPKLVKPCVVGCSNCYNHCPMNQDFDPKRVFGKSEIDPLIGSYREITAVKASKDETVHLGQDGGAVTAILSAILERGKIDAAIVVERDKKWKPLPRVITSKEDLIKSQGSKYSPSPNIEPLAQVFKTRNLTSVAIVDVGCHIRGVRNLEYDLLYRAGFSPYSDLKIYTIGLFCLGSFYNKLLTPMLEESPENIKKMDVTEGRFIEISKNKKEMPIHSIKRASMLSCLQCPDATAENADISIGSVGSPDGYSTVIVRNLMGWGMMRDAVQRGYAEADESLVDRKELLKFAKNKKDKVEDLIKMNRMKKRRIPGFMLSRPFPQ